MIKIKLVKRLEPQLECSCGSQRIEERHTTVEGLNLFRLHCLDCGNQWVPDDVEQIGGFGII